MNSYKKPYILFKRPRKKGYVWYYRLAGEKTGHSTGQTKKWMAEEFVEEQVLPLHRGSDLSLGEYLEPYYDWERCPHINRLRTENKSISQKYAKEQRARLKNYILDDPICSIPIAHIRRAHLIDYRARLVQRRPRDKPIGMRTANLTMQALKVAIREAFFREDIDRDPTVGIGDINYDEVETGVFTEEEIKTLFEERPGIWKDIQGYTAFILASHAGLRRSEVLALTWRQIDFNNMVIHVDRAQTDNDLPKWDKVRWAPITRQCSEALTELRSKSMYILPHQPVFCDKQGDEHGPTWWQKRFKVAMKTAEINTKDRHIKPHSFRHSLNTSLRGSGFDPSRIRDSLGWSGEQVQDGYTHWAPEHFQEQRQKTEELYGS